MRICINNQPRFSSLSQLVDVVQPTLHYHILNVWQAIIIFSFFQIFPSVSSLQPFDRNYINNPGAMVVFATPGMLHAGLSLQIFKHWASNEKNMVIMPGYCVAGTVGSKVLAGQKRIEMENRQVVSKSVAINILHEEE